MCRRAGGGPGEILAESTGIPARSGRRALGAEDPGEPLRAVCACGRCGGGRIADDACLEPDHEFVVRDGVVGHAHDQIEDGVVGVEAVPAAPEQQLDEMASAQVTR